MTTLSTGQTPPGIALTSDQIAAIAQILGVDVAEAAASSALVAANSALAVATSAQSTASSAQSTANTAQATANAASASAAAAQATALGITKTSIGLGNVDNTSDINKPVSTAQAAAIATIDPTLAISGITYNGSSQITGYTQNGQAYVITYGASGVGGASVPVTKVGNGHTTTYHYTSGLLTSTTVV